MSSESAGSATMNFRKLASWILGSGRGIPVQPITDHRDPDIGDYHFFPVVNLWSHRRPYGTGELAICGRSAQPTVEQKQLLEVFLPILASLTKVALKNLEPPKGFGTSDIPKMLQLQELRFEATGEVQLIFGPALEDEGVETCPMATFSPEGQLQSVYWIV
jgi:hypothetical protein